MASQCGSAVLCSALAAFEGLSPHAGVAHWWSDCKTGRHCALAAAVCVAERAAHLIPFENFFLKPVLFGDLSQQQGSKHRTRCHACCGRFGCVGATRKDLCPDSGQRPVPPARHGHTQLGARGRERTAEPPNAPGRVESQSRRAVLRRSAPSRLPPAGSSCFSQPVSYWILALGVPRARFLHAVGRSAAFWAVGTTRVSLGPSRQAALHIADVPAART